MAYRNREELESKAISNGQDTEINLSEESLFTLSERKSKDKSVR